MTAEREEALRLLRLAERDHRVFVVLLAGGASEDFPAAAFHAQQAVEKMLKAVLCVNLVAFKRTHDLSELAGRLSDCGVAPPLDTETLLRLTPYAVEFRYDDQVISLITAEEAQRAVVACLLWARNILEKPDE